MCDRLSEVIKVRNMSRDGGCSDGGRADTYRDPFRAVQRLTQDASQPQFLLKFEIALRSLYKLGYIVSALL